MIKAHRLTHSQCRKLLFPEAYDVFAISDWSIWELNENGKRTYALVTRFGLDRREIHSYRLSADELSYTIINIANGGKK